MKLPTAVERCSSCNLVFSRLEKATNKQGKKELLSGNRKNLVYVKGCPKDVNRIVLTLLAGFLGVFGAHNFYVGRYGKGVFSLAVGIFSVFYVSYLPAYDIFKNYISLISIFVGVVTLMWLFDFINICFNKYKIPVALEVE